MHKPTLHQSEPHWEMYELLGWLEEKFGDDFDADYVWDYYTDRFKNGDFVHLDTSLTHNIEQINKFFKFLEAEFYTKTFRIRIYY